MDNETKPDVSLLAAKAAQVAASQEELTSAIAEERAARAAVLVHAIESVRPAWRALSSRIQSRAEWSGLATDRQRASEDYLPERGLYLGYDSAGPSKDAPRDNQGAYEGVDYFLLSDGRIARLEYLGEWSHWQGSSSRWEASVTYYSLQEGAEKLVAVGWDARALSAIESALTRHVEGKAPERARAARERAARLRALVTLSG